MARKCIYEGLQSFVLNGEISLSTAFGYASILGRWPRRYLIPERSSKRETTNQTSKLWLIPVSLTMSACADEGWTKLSYEGFTYLRYLREIDKQDSCCTFGRYLTDRGSQLHLVLSLLHLA